MSYDEYGTLPLSNSNQPMYNTDKPYYGPIKRYLDDSKNLETKSRLLTSNQVYQATSKKIGNGNFGQVYKTKNNSAFKTLAKKCLYDNEAWGKFLKEYDLWEYISKMNTNSEGKSISKNIAMVKELNDFILDSAVENSPFKFVGISMKLYKQDLNSHITELKETHEYSKDKVIFLMQNIVKGVRALHKFNVIHGDIAKRNFLVDNKGRVVITDFGLSHKVLKKAKDADEKDIEDLSATMRKSSFANESPLTYGQYYEDEDPQAQPFWWCAPEIIEDMLAQKGLRYSKKTDSYMVGCTFSELIVDESSFDKSATQSNQPQHRYIPFSFDAKNNYYLTDYASTKRIQACLKLKKNGPLELKKDKIKKEFRSLRKFYIDLTLPDADKRSGLEVIEDMLRALKLEEFTSGQQTNNYDTIGSVGAKKRDSITSSLSPGMKGGVFGFAKKLFRAPSFGNKDKSDNQLDQEIKKTASQNRFTISEPILPEKGDYLKPETQPDSEDLKPAPLISERKTSVEQNEFGKQTQVNQEKKEESKNKKSQLKTITNYPIKEAMIDYEADEPDELSYKAGDLIIQTSPADLSGYAEGALKKYNRSARENNPDFRLTGKFYLNFMYDVDEIQL